METEREIERGGEGMDYCAVAGRKSVPRIREEVPRTAALGRTLEAENGGAWTESRKTKGTGARGRVNGGQHLARGRVNGGQHWRQRRRARARGREQNGEGSDRQRVGGELCGHMCGATCQLVEANSVAHP